MLKPRHIIPTHGTAAALIAFKNLAEEVGYRPEQVKIVVNGERVKVA